MRATEGNWLACGFQALAVSTAAVGLTIPVTATSGFKARAAYLQVDTGDIRWRDDGVDPTSAIGAKLQVDNDLFYPGDLTKIRFIRVSVDAVVNVSYYY